MVNTDNSAGQAYGVPGVAGFSGTFHDGWQVQPRRAIHSAPTHLGPCQRVLKFSRASCEIRFPI